MKHTITIGQRFGEWTVIGERGPTYVMVRCSCGQERWVQVGNLVSGKTTKCVACQSVFKQRGPEPMRVVAKRYGTTTTAIGWAVKFLGWEKMIEWYERENAKAPPQP